MSLCPNCKKEMGEAHGCTLPHGDVSAAFLRGWDTAILLAAKRVVEDGCCWEDGPCANEVCEARWGAREDILKLRGVMA
jgi:hypothetical protein